VRRGFCYYVLQAGDGCPTPRTPFALSEQEEAPAAMGEGVAGALTDNCTGPEAGSLRLSPVKSKDFWAL
jgi:hypothetical protein